MEKEQLNNLKRKPHFKQFSELILADFDDHPVWVNCHLVDYDEPWYDEINEETFRPWIGDIPIDPNKATFLVKATFTIADGTVLNGFITPVSNVNKDVTEILGSIQPYIFALSGKRIHFWFGSIPCSDEGIKNIYYLLEKNSKDIFPIEFVAESGLVKGVTSGTIPGFCYMEENRKVKIIR